MIGLLVFFLDSRRRISEWNWNEIIWIYWIFFQFSIFQKSNCKCSHHLIKWSQFSCTQHLII